MAPTQQSTHRSHLVERFGEETVRHLSGFIDERVVDLIHENNALMGRARVVREDAAKSGDPEAAEAANEATQAAKKAAKATQTAKDSGNPEDVEVAKSETKKAKDKVDKAETRVREMVETHERVLAERTNGPRPPSRIDAIEVRLQDVENRSPAGHDHPSIAAYALALFLVVGVILVIIAVFNDNLTVIEALSIAGLAALLTFLVDQLAHIFPRRNRDNDESQQENQRQHAHAG